MKLMYITETDFKKEDEKYDLNNNFSNIFNYLQKEESGFNKYSNQNFIFDGSNVEDTHKNYGIEIILSQNMKEIELKSENPISLDLPIYKKLVENNYRIETNK